MADAAIERVRETRCMLRLRRRRPRERSRLFQGTRPVRIPARRAQKPAGAGFPRLRPPIRRRVQVGAVRQVARQAVDIRGGGEMLRHQRHAPAPERQRLGQRHHRRSGHAAVDQIHQSPAARHRYSRQSELNRRQNTPDPRWCCRCPPGRRPEARGPEPPRLRASWRRRYRPHGHPPLAGATKPRGLRTAAGPPEPLGERGGKGGDAGRAVRPQVGQLAGHGGDGPALDGRQRGHGLIQPGPAPAGGRRPCPPPAACRPAPARRA